VKTILNISFFKTEKQTDCSNKQQIGNYLIDDSFYKREIAYKKIIGYIIQQNQKKG